jgi:hypothetical protein
MAEPVPDTGQAQSYTNTVIVTFNDFSDISDFTLNGNTASINSGGPVFFDGQYVLRLTDDLWQGGSAFLTHPITLEDSSGFQASFSTAFSFQITGPQGISDSDGQGADGIVFVVQTNANNVGGVGEGIGYSGIGNSIGIEFDTWNNGSSDGNNGNHVGINLNGSTSSAARYNVLTRMNNGNVWYAWVDYDGNNDLLEVRLSQTNSRPETALLSHIVDLVQVLGTPYAYIGFTSGTGRAGGDHDIQSWQFTNSHVGNGDVDGDGMPDDWEYDYGLDPLDPTDAEGDLDSDGLNNLDEYLNNTNPGNPDTDGDGISDGDEVNYGNDPLAFDSVDVINKSGDVIVSLTGDNRLFVEVFNRFCVPKAVQFELSDLDQSWYSIASDDQSFTLMPFGKRVVSVQLHLPDDCNTPTQTYPFSVQINWEHGGQTFSSSDTGNLVVTPNPNVYPLAIPEDTRLAGNTIFAAWKTDIPVTSYVYYRKLGDEEYVEVPVATDSMEHTVMLTDLDYFTYYEFYTESHSSCGGLTKSDNYLTKTGTAVKFVNSVNEVWVDRDYNQLVTLSITNTDLLDHTYQLSVINDNEDIVVGFVGDGTSTREATLSPGESRLFTIFI